jgi:MFS family permease
MNDVSATETAPATARGEPAVSAARAYASPVYAWYVVAVLTLTYTIAFIDRQIMALMIEPIRRDLQISDTQVSLLIGLAFAVFYTLLGIPIARLADRYSRRAIIAVGIAIWCVMTATCGLARNYAQLFLSRVGVGVGEAALSPSALSIISDYFPPQQRARAIAVYNTGISLGTGLALIVGGTLIAHVMQAPPVTVPLIGTLHAWQTVFLVVGLPGLVMALLMLTVREPERRERMAATAGGAHLSLRDVTGFLLKRVRMYASHFLGMSTAAILAYGLAAWVPTMFVRTWDWNIRDIGIAYGIVTLVAAPLAVLVASRLGDYFARRGHDDAPMKATLVGIGLAAVGAVGAAVSPLPWLSIALLLPASVGTTAATASGLAALMMVTPNQIRAQSAALFYLVVNVLGLTLGPTGIALLTDYVFRDTLALRYSVATASTVAGLFSVAFLLYNLGQYRRQVAESRTWTSANPTETAI